MSEKQNKKQLIKEKIKKLKEERDDYLEALKRERASFLNYKKETIQKTTHQVERAKREMISGLLPILDNFQRAAEEAKKRAPEDDLIMGILRIKDQLERFLKDEGVEEIDVKDKDFDPIYHEAIEVVDCEDREAGKITEELQKGYTYKSEVIRPSKVKVTK